MQWRVRALCEPWTRTARAPKRLRISASASRACMSTMWTEAMAAARASATLPAALASSIAISAASPSKSSSSPAAEEAAAAAAAAALLAFLRAFLLACLLDAGCVGVSAGGGGGAGAAATGGGSSSSSDSSSAALSLSSPPSSANAEGFLLTTTCCSSSSSSSDEAAPDGSTAASMRAFAAWRVDMVGLVVLVRKKGFLARDTSAGGVCVGSPASAPEITSATGASAAQLSPRAASLASRRAAPILRWH